MIQFQEITRTECSTEGRQTLFYRTIPANAGGPTSTTAVEQHLKVKDIEYDIGITKNYCMTVSMQKISSIHKLILKIQQILGPHELNDHAKPQITEITFSFPQFGRACKKSVHPIYLSLRCSQFQSPVTRLAIPTFDHAHPNIWKSCNLGLYYLGPYLKNKVFTKYGICAGTQQIM